MVVVEDEVEDEVVVEDEAVVEDEVVVERQPPIATRNEIEM